MIQPMESKKMWRMQLLRLTRLPAISKVAKAKATLTDALIETIVRAIPGDMNDTKYEGTTIKMQTDPEGLIRLHLLFLKS